MQIRPLTDKDAHAYRELRIRALTDHPESFLTSADTFAQLTLASIEERLRNEASEGNSFILGAFLDERLVGMVGLARDSGEKIRHKAFIWGVYVVDEVRGQGLARALMDEAIARARLLSGLEILYLGVVTTNTRARSLYIALGFEIYGIERQAIKLGGQYLDEEMMALWLH